MALPNARRCLGCYLLARLSHHCLETLCDATLPFPSPHTPTNQQENSIKSHMGRQNTLLPAEVDFHSRKRPKRPRRDDDIQGSTWRRCSLARVLSVALCCLCCLKRAAGEVRSVSRVYHSACLERGQSYWDYENFQLSSVGWEDVDRYEVTGRLGFGRFSEVRWLRRTRPQSPRGLYAGSEQIVAVQICMCVVFLTELV